MSTVPHTGIMRAAHPIALFEMLDKNDETKNTHLWLVNRSVEVAAQEANYGKAIQQFLQTNANQMHRGLWDADNQPPYNDPVGVAPTYKSHFYDPTSGKNYLGDTDPTAVTRSVEFFEKALVSYWNGNASSAAYWLGLSLHYITDAGQPMHSTNFTALSFPPMYHGGFEQYVIDWVAKGKNRPFTIAGYKQTITSDDPADYTIAAAKGSHPFGDTVCGQPAIAAWTDVPRDVKTWQSLMEPIMVPMLSTSIATVSQYLVLWMKHASAKHPWEANTLSIDEGDKVDLMLASPWDVAQFSHTPTANSAWSNADDTKLIASVHLADGHATDNTAIAVLGQCFVIDSQQPYITATFDYAFTYSLAVSSHLTAWGTGRVELQVVELVDAINIWDDTDPYAYADHSLYIDAQQTATLSSDPKPVSNTQITGTTPWTLQSKVPYVVMASLRVHATSWGLANYTLDADISISKLTISV